MEPGAGRKGMFPLPGISVNTIEEEDHEASSRTSTVEGDPEPEVFGTAKVAVLSAKRSKVNCSSATAK